MPRYGDGAAVGYADEPGPLRRNRGPIVVGAAGAYGLGTAIRPPVKGVERLAERRVKAARSAHQRAAFAYPYRMPQTARDLSVALDSQAKDVPRVVARITSKPYRLKRGAVSGVLLAGAGLEAYRRKRKRDADAQVW